MTERLKLYRVRCGSLKWKGTAENVDHAIINALSRELPDSPGTLLCVHDGLVNHYIDFRAALKLAGYTTRKTKHGFKIV